MNDFCIKKLASCTKLKYVNFSGCKYLTDSSISQIVGKCKDIYHLNLTRIPKLTAKGLSAVASAGLKNLEYLNLYANANIEDEGFRALAQANCPLQFLDLCGCKELLDDSVIALAK